MCVKGVYLLDDLLSIDEYVQFKLDGYEDEVVALKLHVGLTTLERWKTRHGVTRKTVNLARAKYIEERLKRGLSVKQIASFLHLTPRNVHYIIKQYGVDKNETYQNN
jgi:transcriptional regulator with GAF, ATPase, and Fis domain